MLAEPDEEGADVVSQISALILMTLIGLASAWRFYEVWDYTLRLHEKMAAALWLIFWLGPPIYFLWTKGVRG